MVPNVNIAYQLAKFPGLLSAMMMVFARILEIWYLLDLFSFFSFFTIDLNR